MKIIDLEQGSQEWLDFRKDKIGASDAPIIMGVNSWTTPLQLWRRKLGFEPDIQETERMRRGKELEPIARKIAESKYGCQLTPIVVQHHDFDWMIASFDGYSLDCDFGIEIKCPGQKDHELAKQGKIPEKYRPQLLHQMIVADINIMVYMSYLSDDDIAFVEIQRDVFDQSYVDNFLNKLKSFYDCMKILVEPEVCERDWLDMEYNQDWKETVSNYMYFKQQRELIERKEKEYREKLIALSNNQNSKGCGVKLTKVITKGRIDYSKIELLKDIDLEQYRGKPVESWRIS